MYMYVCICIYIGTYMLYVYTVKLNKVTTTATYVLLYFAGEATQLRVDSRRQREEELQNTTNRNGPID